MNDDIKLLLELAAKAIGYELHINKADAPQLWKGGEYFRFWNPADDDGDSRRLEVALGLNVDVHRQFPNCGWPSPWTEVRGYESRRILAEEVAADNGASLEAATRLAVLRAAAEIGRNME